MTNFDGILLCAGNSTRLQQSIPKQFIEISPQYTIMEMSLDTIVSFSNRVIITLPAQGHILTQNIQDRILQKYSNKDIIFIEGGNSRYESTQKAFQLIQSEYFFIHDGARPLTHPDDVKNLLQSTEKHKACILAKPAQDTIKLCTKNRVIEKTIDRNAVWLAETPQAFETNLYRESLQSIDMHTNITDDASIIETKGLMPVHIVPSLHINFKITYESDLKILTHLIQKN